MPVSNQKLFTARQRSALEDITDLQLKLEAMRKLCPKHSDEMDIVLKALARVQQKFRNIKQDNQK